MTSRRNFLLGGAGISAAAALYKSDCLTELNKEYLRGC
ncbi:twin-arginine translocation signal domain-containing protein [Paraglaciecola sp. L3A3]